MVFQAPNEQRVRDLFAQLEEEAQYFLQRQGEDSYMLVGYDNETHTFLRHEFSIQSP